MKVTIRGQQVVYYAYEADYEDLLEMAGDKASEMPAPDQLKREDQADIQEGWITQEMRESFADTAYEVDSSEMEWTEIEVTDG